MANTKKPFKCFDNNAVQNARWKLKDPIEGIMINSGTSSISWRRNTLQQKKYTTIIQACKIGTNEILREREITFYGNAATFFEAIWSLVAQTAKNGWEYLWNCFGFQNKTDVIGLIKQIKIKKSFYRVKVMAIEHDEKVDGSGKALLTFEIEEFICDNSSKQAMNYKFYNEGFTETDPRTGELIVNGFNNWEESDLREIIREFSSPIEIENCFEITEVYKKMLLFVKKRSK